MSLPKYEEVAISSLPVEISRADINWLVDIFEGKLNLSFDRAKWEELSFKDKERDTPKLINFVFTAKKFFDAQDTYLTNLNNIQVASSRMEKNNA